MWILDRGIMDDSSRVGSEQYDTPSLKHELSDDDLRLGASLLPLCAPNGVAYRYAGVQELDQLMNGVNPSRPDVQRRRRKTGDLGLIDKVAKTNQIETFWNKDT